MEIEDKQREREDKVVPSYGADRIQPRPKASNQ